MLALLPLVATVAAMACEEGVGRLVLLRGGEAASDFALLVQANVSMRRELQVLATFDAAASAPILYVNGSNQGYLLLERNFPEKVRVVEKNCKVTVASEMVHFWNLDRLNQEGADLDGNVSVARPAIAPAATTTVYVLDTYVLVTHEQFVGRWEEGYAVYPEACTSQGHGTHVAGTALGNTVGVAREAVLVPVTVLSCDGTGYMTDIVAGLDWMISDHEGRTGPAVATMSLGALSINENMYASMSAILEAAVDGGITVAAAAGNDGGNAKYSWPANQDYVIAVGNTEVEDETDEIAPTSNTGADVNIYAPGTNIYSSWVPDDDSYAVSSLSLIHI